MSKAIISVTKNGQNIASNVEIADTFMAKLKGLLGREKLESGQGMLLYPCNSIHCIGMKFTIDAIFMNEEKKVIGLRPGMNPGDKAYVYKAHYVLEVEEGVIESKRIVIGDFLEWRI